MQIAQCLIKIVLYYSGVYWVHCTGRLPILHHGSGRDISIWGASEPHSTQVILNTYYHAQALHEQILVNDIFKKNEVLKTMIGTTGSMGTKLQIKAYNGANPGRQRCREPQIHRVHR